MINSNLIYTNGMIVGLHDSDGTFTNVITLRKERQVGFSIRASFDQKTSNKDVLEGVKNRLGVKSKIVQKSKKTSKSPKSNKSKLISKSTLDVNFNTPPGQRLLDIWRECPPITPGKRRDYRISCIISAYALSGTFSISNKKTTTSTQIANLVMIWLTYQNSSEQKKTNTNKSKRKPIKDFYDHIGATQNDINTSILIGQKLIEEIDKEEQTLCEALDNIKTSNLIIPKDYIVGFHIGDGSLQVGIDFIEKEDKPLKIKINPYWTLVECSKGLSLLRGIRRHFKEGSVRSEIEAVRYKVQSWEGCERTIIPILKEFENSLPKYRKEQFEKFYKAFNMCKDKNHLTSFDKLEALIDLVWDMNREGELRRSTKEQMLEKAKRYFENK
jgi:hypothetical protein